MKPPTTPPELSPTAAALLFLVICLTMVTLEAWHWGHLSW